MTSFFDEEEILKYYIRCERHEATKRADKATAKRMIKAKKFTLEEIAQYVPSLSLKELKEIEAKLLQPAQ